MRSVSRLVPMLGMLVIGCGGGDAPAIIRNDTGSSPSVSVATPASAVSSSVAAGVVAGALPADVTGFRERRDQCDHFRGEEAGDDARAAELEKALERTCRGTDAELAGLRQRYRGNAAVIAALRDYEDQVE